MLEVQFCIFQRLSVAGALQKLCFLKFQKIHRRTPVSESLKLSLQLNQKKALAQVFPNEFFDSISGLELLFHLPFPLRSIQRPTTSSGFHVIKIL